MPSKRTKKEKKQRLVEEVAKEFETLLEQEARDESWSEIKRRTLRPKLRFQQLATNFNGQINIWRIDVPEDYPANADTLSFTNSIKVDYIRVVKSDIENLGSVKITLSSVIRF